MNKIFKNAFWLALAEALTRGISFLLFVWMARHYGPYIYGQWAYALSFAGLFAVLTDFGFSSLAVRELARDKARISEFVGNVLTMKLVLGALTIGLINLVSGLLGQEDAVLKLVWFVAFYIVANNFAVFLNSVFRAQEKMFFESFSRALQGLILFCLSALFISAGKPVIYISYAHIAAALSGILISAFMARNFFARFSFKAQLSAFKEILKEAWPFLFSGMFYMAYFQFGSVMLGVFSEMDQVGYYNAAYGPLGVVIVIPGILTASFYPRLAGLFKENKPEFLKTFYNLRNILMFLGFPLAVFLFLSSGWLICLVYSENYAESVFLLKILSAACIFKFLNYAYSYFLTSANGQKMVLACQTTATLASFSLNYFLIISKGALGAAWAMVTAEILLFLLYLLFFNLKKKQIFSSPICQS